MNRNERLERLNSSITDELVAMIVAREDNNEFPSNIVNAVGGRVAEIFKQGRAELERTRNIAALEAIVKRVGRPPLLIRGGVVQMEPLPKDFPLDTPGLIKSVEKWLPSVGRIEFVNASMEWGGTGFVIDAKGNSRTIVTNRHVANEVARRKADGQGVFIRSPIGLCGANIDFGEEVDSADNNALTATLSKIVYIADDISADVALFEIEAANFQLPDPVVLAAKEASKGDLVAVIGYPAYDSRNNDSDQARYFRDLYEVKRFAPGFVTHALSGQSALRYDCTTLGGNSGSPVLDLHSGEVVGLHFSGVYGEYNAAVGVKTLDALRRGRTVAVPDALASAGDGGEGASDGHHDTKFFEHREGFDQAFLGKAHATPWPGLPADRSAGLAKPSDDPAEPFELRYRHFGVKYSGELKLPLITAVNIDGEHAVRIKRTADKWCTDARIDLKVQLGAKNFADAQIDRGHMVRREDPNWDLARDEAEASIANFDTFHYVNACAQHSSLNQGKQLWQGLENYILDSSRTNGFKACVFTGPVLRPADGEDEEVVLDGAIVPLEFWKLVVTLDVHGKALHATAYLLSQGQLIRALLERRSRTEAVQGFELGAYRTFQLAISDLAEATGYDFSAYVTADPLAKAAANEGVEQGEPIAVPIDDLRSLVL